MSCSKHLALLLWLALAPACTCGGKPEAPLRLDSVEPTWGYDSEVTPLVLHGANFTPRATLKLGAAQGDLLAEASFQVFVGEHALGEVSWVGSTELTASVPAGLAAGMYAVRVIDPWGVEVTLADAYEVRARKGAVLDASISTPQRSVRLGSAIEAWVDVHNLGDGLARQVVVQPAPPAGTGAAQLSSVSPAMASLAPGETARFTVTWVSTQLGEVTLGAVASGVDVRTSRGVAAELVTAPVSIIAPAVLMSAVSTDRLVYSVGQPIALELQVDNVGPSAVLGLAPLVTISPAGAAAPRTNAAARELGPGATERFPFTFEALAPAQVTFEVQALGLDQSSGTPVAIPGVSQEITIVSRPALTLALTGSASQLDTGSRFTLTAVIANSGQAVALAVRPAVSVAGTGGLVEASAPFADAISSQPVSFQWEFDAVSPGSVQLTVSASGLDENSGEPVGPMPAMLTLLINPADAGVDAGEADAGAVDAGSLDAGSPDAGSPGDAGSPDAGSPDAGSPDAGSPDAGGDGGTADAGFDAGIPDAGGGDAGSADAGTGGDGGEVRTLFADPFGDGTPATFVIGYRSKVYVGPNRTGSGAIRFDPDGTSPETISFSFSRDSTGNTSSNTSSAPYPSLGSAGCAANTPACGPDNENGRGLFFETQFADAGWLGAAGGRTGQSFSYVYFTPDTDAVLDFRYVDISNFVGAGTCQLASAAQLGSRVYLGFGGSSGARRPSLLALNLAPPSPGLNPTGSALVDLEADLMPSISNGGGAANNNMIDAIATLNDRLYLGAYGGLVRSTTPTPGPYSTNPGDWAGGTPNDAAYAAKLSTTTTKRVDLEPSDRAVPAFATFGGRLYMARNTTTGPQLWACDPVTSGGIDECQPSDWYLVGANSQGDPQLTQFNDAANTRITLLKATPTHLYVGFNNAARGVVVFRSAAPSPLTRADFTGTGGCSAMNYPLGCDGYGRSGLGGGNTSTRVYDSVVLPFAGSDYLYVVIGDGTSGVRVVRVEP